MWPGKLRIYANWVATDFCSPFKKKKKKKKKKEMRNYKNINKKYKQSSLDKLRDIYKLILLSYRATLLKHTVRIKLVTLVYLFKKTHDNSLQRMPLDIC